MKTASHTYFIPEVQTDKFESLMIANALMTELLPYKITLNAALFLAIAKLPNVQAHEFARDILADYTIGKLNRPLFEDWENRTYFSVDEFVIQIWGYAIQLSGNDLYDPGYMAMLLERAHATERELSYLQLASVDEARTVFIELASANVAQNKEAQKNLFKAARIFTNSFAAIPYIKSDEARVLVLNELVKNVSNANDIVDVFVKLKCKPADVMRYACSKNGELDGIKLPHDLKFAPLNWQERKAIVAFLNVSFTFEKLSESFGLNRGAWKKFFRHIHLFNQAEFFQNTNVIVSAMVSVGFNNEKIPTKFRAAIKGLVRMSLVDVTDTGNLAYRTFASRVETALASKDLETIKRALGTNTSYLLRNIGSISNAITKRDEPGFVSWIREQLNTADVNVLFSILAINVDSKFRVIDVKGDTIIQPADYSQTIREIQGDIKRALWARFGYEGTVEVDQELKNKIVPFLSKNSELERGSKIKFKENLYLYFLCHWVQKEFHRTDLDTSYVAFDSNWNTETIYFGNQANEYIAHSGDLTNAPAPHGATEYGRIDLSAIPEHVRYIVPIINVFSGSVFNENETAYAGFMFSDQPYFDIERDHVRYDLSQPANANIPFIIDIKNQEIIVVDYNNRRRLGATAHSEIENIKNLISATNSHNPITIQKLANILSGSVNNERSLRISNDPGALNVSPDRLFNLFTERK